MATFIMLASFGAGTYLDIISNCIFEKQKADAEKAASAEGAGVV